MLLRYKVDVFKNNKKHENNINRFGIIRQITNVWFQ